MDHQLVSLIHAIAAICFLTMASTQIYGMIKKTSVKEATRLAEAQKKLAVGKARYFSREAIRHDEAKRFIQAAEHRNCRDKFMKKAREFAIQEARFSSKMLKAS